MDRQMLLDHLAMAERHVVRGDLLLGRARANIKKRRHAGHNVKEAERLLDLLEQVQQEHIEHLDKIRKELAEFG